MVGCLSTSKSPQQMFGVVSKTYFAEKLGVSPDRIYSVSIMPCMAKKAEKDIKTINDSGVGKDVDLVLTTRELCRLIKRENINIAMMEESEFDSPLGCSSGAGVIFGTTGGVMEAALRTAYYKLTGVNPEPDQFEQIRNGGTVAGSKSFHCRNKSTDCRGVRTFQHPGLVRGTAPGRGFL